MEEVFDKLNYAEWDEATNSPSDCDFNFFDIIDDLELHYENGLTKTWLKVAAIACSLENNTQYTEKLTYKQVVEGLSCVAWINLSKTPWKPSTKMDDAYYERVRIWEPIVREQLKECSPDIVFYGNTWEASTINPIEPDIEWQNEFCTNTKKYVYTSNGGKQFRICISQYKDSGKLLVNGYHPELGNASQWKTGFIQDYIKAIRKT